MVGYSCRCPGLHVQAAMQESVHERHRNQALQPGAVPFRKARHRLRMGFRTPGETNFLERRRPADSPQKTPLVAAVPTDSHKLPTLGAFIQKIALKAIFCFQIGLTYCPLDSDDAFEESVAEAGALQAFAAEPNCDQADFLVWFQALAALFLLEL